MLQASERARSHRHRSTRYGASRTLHTLSAAMLAAVCMLGSMTVASPRAQADEPEPTVPAAEINTAVADTRMATADELNAELSDLSDRSTAADDATEPAAPAAPRSMRVATSSRATVATGAGGKAIGDTLVWYLQDTVRNTYVGVRFVLRVVAPHSEIWVQQNTDFPSGDCRNDGVRNVVTTEQAQALAEQFEDNILPVESSAFSTARGRDGSKGPTSNGVPDYGGKADTTVILVGNIRDADFYSPNTPDGSTYIAGYFSPVLTEFFDRNIMTIDSYDWAHRTGANPPATTATCLPRPAIPYQYERTFAPEDQHLLEYYQDPTENTWLNEGLSMYAQTLTGYSDTRIQYPGKGAELQLACFQGFLAPVLAYCGAQNSLTQWADQGQPSILADLGAVQSFVTYVADHFGEGAVTALHRSPLHGLASLDGYLKAHATRGLSATDVVHDWATAMAVDGWIDDCARGLWGNQARRFSSAQLSSAVDWTFNGSYASPGATPNGSDYVLATDGRPVNVRTIDSISFRGADAFTAPSGSAVPVANWSVQLIGWSSDGRTVRVADLPLSTRNRIRLERAELKTYLRGADRVGLVITPDDPTETATGPAPYRLLVNGTLQPGGGELPKN